jgi:hypothetical protein
VGGGVMPDRDATRVLRPTRAVAAAAAASAPPPAVAAREESAAPATAVAEPPAPAARSTMVESRNALKKEVRQVQQPRRAEPAVPLAPPPAPPSNTKMFVFMALGIVAGAAAAVVAVKWLLHL